MSSQEASYPSGSSAGAGAAILVIQMVDLAESSGGKPFIFWRKEPRDDAKDCDRTKYDGREVECFRSDWEEQRREEYSREIRVPDLSMRSVGVSLTVPKSTY